MANYLRRLRLTELSLVDRPANKGARVSLFKRELGGLPVVNDDAPELAFYKRSFSAEERRSATEAGEAMPGGRYPIKTTQDLHNAIRALGRGKGSHADIRAHIRRRAKALGAEDSLPEDWSKGDTPMTLEQRLKKLEDDNAALTKKLDDQAAAGAEALKKAQENADRIAKMTDDEKAHCDGMSSDARDAFMAKTPDDRKAAMKKRATDDEVLTVAGATIRKSVVGEGVFAVLKAQNDQITETNAKLAKANEDAVHATFVKRAETELAHLPGTAEEKAPLLKAVAAITDQKQRDAALAALKAGNAAMNTRLRPIGQDGSPAPITKAAEALAKKVEDHMADNKGVTKAAAYDAVLKTEAGKQLYADAEAEKRGLAA